MSQTISFPLSQNRIALPLAVCSPRMGHLELLLPGPAHSTDLQTPRSSVLLLRPYHKEQRKKCIYFINDYICIYTHTKRGRASHRSDVFTLIVFAKCSKLVTALSAQSRWQQFDFTERSSQKACVLRHFSLF